MKECSSPSSLTHARSSNSSSLSTFAMGHQESAASLSTPLFCYKFMLVILESLTNSFIHICYVDLG